MRLGLATSRRMSVGRRIGRKSAENICPDLAGIPGTFAFTHAGVKGVDISFLMNMFGALAVDRMDPQATPKVQSITNTTTPPCFSEPNTDQSTLQSFRSPIARFNTQHAAALLCKSLISEELPVSSLVSGLQTGMLRCRRLDDHRLLMIMSRAFLFVRGSVGEREKTRAKGRRHWLRECASEPAGGFG